MDAGHGGSLNNRQGVESTVRFGAFLLVIASGIALFLTGRVQASGLILLVACPIAWFAGKKPSKSRFWDVASFVYLIFLVIDIFRISGSLAIGLVHLFIFILVNKTFNLNAPRDYYHLYLLTFLSMLAATSLSVEIEMFYVIIVYVVLFVWNFISLTLLQEWKKEHHATVFPIRLMSPVYWLVVTAMSLVTLGIALGIFFVLPRMQLGFFSNVKNQRLEHVTGFSQKVSLGEMASIRENTGLVMRVHVTGKRPPGHSYWRGIGFDHYDGKSWTSSSPNSHYLHQDSAEDFTNYRFLGDQSLIIKQEVYMEPVDTRVVFGLDRVTRLEGKFGAITRDMNGSLTGFARPQNYIAYSRVPVVSREYLKTAGRADIPENIRRYYLQLPLNSPQIQALADQIASKNALPIDRILAVQKYLEDDYLYSTTDLPQDDVDPISVFLFEKKSGHCEFFATAMAVLLRYQGIPARVVNGFLEGEYNEIGDFYMVRQSDAHSWVEVYLDGMWYPFDPSPRPFPYEERNEFFDFRKIFESVSYFWDRYILVFSAEDQFNALSEIRNRYEEIANNLKDVSGQSKGPLSQTLFQYWKGHRFTIVLIVAVLAGIGPALRFYLGFRRRARMLRTPILFYQEMLTILARKGFARAPQVTPFEFVDSVSEELPVAQNDLRHLTDLFYKARFGDYHLNDMDQQTIRQSLNRLDAL